MIQNIFDSQVQQGRNLAQIPAGEGGMQKKEKSLEVGVSPPKLKGMQACI